MLATRGYGVLLPDAPLRVGTPMEDLAATVLPALDTLVALGLADRDRLALMGHSYGGYSVLAILVQTNRFRAAISSGGFSNLFSHYSEMREDGSAVGIGWSERDQGRMGGSPWQYRDRYLENSPYFFLDKVTTPVLLLHGGADATVLPARAAETFVALRRLGKTVTLVRYDGEGHHPGSWSVANAADYWRRIFEWLDTHLAPR
jgi:dipeptidyl aminopeptidase/acylaminoacyl peptidase